MQILPPLEASWFLVGVVAALVAVGWVASLLLVGDLPGVSRRPRALRLGVGAALTATATASAAASLGGKAAGVLTWAVVVALVVAFAPLTRSWAVRGLLAWAAALASAVALSLATIPVPSGDSSAVGVAAGIGLWVAQSAVLAVTLAQVHTALDVVARRRHGHRVARFTPVGRTGPLISVHVPIRDERPEVVLDVLRAVALQEYDAMEIVVVAHGAHEPTRWEPVAQFCSGHPGARFESLGNWPGGRAGALNFALTRTDPQALVVAVVGPDHLIAPDLLSRAGNLFGAEDVAFVQSVPLQPLSAASYDLSLRAGDSSGLATLVEAPALIRRSALTAAGGWNEQHPEPENDLAFRLAKGGGVGLRLAGEFAGRMETPRFSELRLQRFRAGRGAVQLLAAHPRSLVPWRRRADDSLNPGQRWVQLTAIAERVADLVGPAATAAMIVLVLQLRAGTPVTPGLVWFTAVSALTLFLAVIRAMSALCRPGVMSWQDRAKSAKVWMTTTTAGSAGVLRGLFRPRGESAAEDTDLRLTAESALATIAFGGAVVAGGVSELSGQLLAAALAGQGALYLAAPLTVLAERRQAPRVAPSYGWLVRAGMPVTSVAVALALIFAVSGPEPSAGADREPAALVQPSRLELVVTMTPRSPQQSPLVTSAATPQTGVDAPAVSAGRTRHLGGAGGPVASKGPGQGSRPSAGSGASTPTASGAAKHVKKHRTKHVKKHVKKHRTKHGHRRAHKHGQRHGDRHGHGHHHH